MPSDGPVAACHDRNNADDYRPAADHEIERRGPCRFCFPDGEIHVADDELLVSPSSKSDSVLHRTDATDGLEWTPGGGGGRHDLFNAISKESVTTLDALAEELEGGEA